MNLIKLILTGLLVVFLSGGVMAQLDSPPDPPGTHGSNDDEEPGGNAPISGGVFILLSAGLAYGGIKLYNLISEEGQIDIEE
jgi:hypothetical protein